MVDPAGGKLGTITDIYLDDETGQPEWATVTTGLFGTKATFVALAQAQATGDSVQVPYDQDQVKDAPTCSPTASCRRTTRPSCTATMVKTALTGAALAAMAWSRALGAMLDEAGEVPVQGGTDPSADTPEDGPRPNASSSCCSG
jgi:hypothetical protein